MMKKIFSTCGLAGLIRVTISCNHSRCYTCSSQAYPGLYCDDVYNHSDLQELQFHCQNAGGAWEQH